MKVTANHAVNLLLTLSARIGSGFILAMDSLLLFLLLLGASSDRLSIDAPGGPSRVQVMASARILRGEAIEFGAPVNRRSAQASRDGHVQFEIAPTRTTTALADADGQTIQLLEFP